MEGLVMRHDIQQIQQFLRHHSRPHQGIAEDILSSVYPCSRSTMPGHITASTFILDEAYKHVLLIHHVALNRWLQPGGHVDAGESRLGAALREAEEETGLKVKAVVPRFLDVDIHRIPTNAKKQEPAHWHLDVRFLCVAEGTQPLINDKECSGYRWQALTDLLIVPEESFRRFAQRAIETLQEINRAALV